MSYRLLTVQMNISPAELLPGCIHSSAIGEPKAGSNEAPSYHALVLRAKTPVSHLFELVYRAAAQWGAFVFTPAFPKILIRFCARRYVDPGISLGFFGFVNFS